MDPDDGAAKEVVEPVFVASGVAVADVAGTRGNAFEENESDREPSKSISPLLEVVGAAGKKHKVMSTKLGTCCLSKMTSNKTLRQALQNHYYQHQTTNVWK